MIELLKRDSPLAEIKATVSTPYFTEAGWYNEISEKPSRAVCSRNKAGYSAFAA
jgi:hypothetical protein